MLFRSPSLYAISDSAHWANKCDIGIVIWKPHRDRDITELSVRKSRYHDQIGRPGEVMMRFNVATRRFDLETAGDKVAA